MLAFSTLIKKADGSTQFVREALHQLPSELISAVRLKEYEQIDTPGWSRSSFGYWNYASLHPGGDLFVLPSLRIIGEPKPRLRLPNYTIEFTRPQIEQYARQLAEIVERFQAEVDEDFTILVHDLRRLSTSIYHAAEEAKRLLDADAPADEIRNRIQNIIASQSMLRVRTDLLDYSGNPGAYTDKVIVPVHQKLFKVIKSFEVVASRNGAKIWLEGTSYHGAYGPDVFELVAYLLIDNAIKYSPRKSDITVKIWADRQVIKLEFRSVGPQIAPEEEKLIFSRGQRGAEAKRMGLPGSGIGLHLARTLVDQFGGKIWVSTSASQYLIGEAHMTDICFHVDLPLHVQDVRDTLRFKSF